MPVSARQRATRALVQVLLSLAAAYGLDLQVNRDSTDDTIKDAHRRVVRRAHPDKGGVLADAQKLQAAKDDWDAACKLNKTRGRPPQPSQDRAPDVHGQSHGSQASRSRRPQPGPSAADMRSLGDCASSRDVLATRAADPSAEPRTFNFQATGVMFTYHGVQDDAQWSRFVAAMPRQVPAWHGKHWCATWEATKAGRLHVHLYIQFRYPAKRSSRDFMFEGIHPHASTSDYCGEGLCRKKLQSSIDRGMFYCWADKIGTQRDEAGNPCVAGNYMPAWTSAVGKYAVAGRWIDNLWKRHAPTHEVYESYIFLARDGVVARKRNLDACVDHEATSAGSHEIAARVQRIRGNADIYTDYPEIPAVTAWQELFKSDALRYPILIIHGPSFTGKTEYAKSLFPSYLELKVGSLKCFPELMRTFQRGKHAAVILDDVRDMAFLVDHQDKLQGKYDCLVEFATTPGGQRAYSKDLFCIPIMVTVNNSTANLQLMATDDWLGNTRNRVVVTYPPNQ